MRSLSSPRRAWWGWPLVGVFPISIAVVYIQVGLMKVNSATAGCFDGNDYCFFCPSTPCAVDQLALPMLLPAPLFAIPLLWLGQSRRATAAAIISSATGLLWVGGSALIAVASNHELYTELWSVGGFFALWGAITVLLVALGIAPSLRRS